MQVRFTVYMGTKFRDRPGVGPLNRGCPLIWVRFTELMQVSLYKLYLCSYVFFFK